MLNVLISRTQVVRQQGKGGQDEGKLPALDQKRNHSAFLPCGVHGTTHCCVAADVSFC